MLKRKRTWLAAGLIILLVVLLPKCGRDQGTIDVNVDTVTAEAERGDMVITVRASGEIQARESIKVIPAIRRQTTLSEIVPEGTRVVEGDVIARFATDDVDRQLLEAQAKVEQAELKVLSTRTDLDIQMLENSNSIKQARQNLVNARMEIEKLMEGDEPKDIRNAELKVTTGESNYERSVKKHDEARQLLEEGFITENDLEEERIAMDTAKVDWETAQLELKILNEYTVPLNRSQKQAALEKAETELEKTLRQNDVQLRNKQQNYDTALQTLEREKTNLADVEQELKDLVVTAPAAGVLSYGDTDERWRRGEVQAGAQMRPGQVLATIPDMAEVQAVVNVSEANIDVVSTGLTAVVKVEAIPGRTFAGEVVQVAEVPNQTGWLGSDVKEFSVKILLEDGAGLRPGFSCSAEITIDSVKDAVIVPIQGVFRRDETFFIYNRRGVPVEVKLGKVSNTHAQILEGVAEGDEIMLVKPTVEGG